MFCQTQVEVGSEWLNFLIDIHKQRDPTFKSKLTNS